MLIEVTHCNGKTMLLNVKRIDTVSINRHGLVEILMRDHAFYSSGGHFTRDDSYRISVKETMEQIKEKVGINDESK